MFIVMFSGGSKDQVKNKIDGDVAVYMYMCMLNGQYRVQQAIEY